MKQTKAKLVTVYTEAALESRMIRDIDKLGAHGYTITNARGKGHRGERSAAWEANSNIRVEIICSEDLAEKIVDHLQQQYYDNYAMVSFISDIEVLRAKKFID